MQQDRLQYLFKKYIDHNCTKEEYRELMTLIDLADDQVIQSMLDDAYTGKTGNALNGQKAERILSNILGRPQRKLTLHSNWYWLSGIAAAALIAVLFWPGKNITRPSKTLLPEVFRTVSAGNDHRMVKLPDGSTVTLNKKSYLTYSRSFTGNTREVTLVGEGYFDVRHDARRPFLVHADALTVTVLGTAFNIHTGEKVSVTVTRGKVSVSNQQHLLGTITPNQQISFSSKTMLAEKVALNSAQVVQWQAADLYFDNTTMAEAATVLQNRFHKKIEFENPHSKACQFSASFTHGQNLLEIIKVLCTFNNSNFEDKGDIILIKGNGC